MTLLALAEVEWRDGAQRASLGSVVSGLRNLGWEAFIARTEAIEDIVRWFSAGAEGVVNST